MHPPAEHLLRRANHCRQTVSASGDNHSGTNLGTKLVYMPVFGVRDLDGLHEACSWLASCAASQRNSGEKYYVINVAVGKVP